MKMTEMMTTKTRMTIDPAAGRASIGLAIVLRMVVAAAVGP